VNAVGQGSYGRSIQFGSTNSVWQKRKGVNLLLSSYDTTNGTTTGIASYGNFFNVLNLGPVTMDFSRKLLAGIDFVTSSSTPDTLDFYEITDLNAPLLLARYPFPTNHQANQNFIGQVVFAGNKLFAIDANNGLAAFTISSSQGPSIKIVQSPPNIIISWTNSPAGFSLEGTTNLAPPASWSATGTPVTNGEQISVTESVGTGKKFYRLRK
jgi:hypothetical protein